MLALGRSRLRVHHHIRGHNFTDALLDGVAQGVDLLEACRARHTHRRIDKVTIAGAADAHAVDIQYAIHVRNGFGDLLLQSLRGRVQQRIQRAPAKLRADP